jgi:hypothetical protein
MDDEHAYQARGARLVRLVHLASGRLLPADGASSGGPDID